VRSFPLGCFKSGYPFVICHLPLVEPRLQNGKWQMENDALSVPGMDFEFRDISKITRGTG
jgi:hypothetical protein